MKMKKLCALLLSLSLTVGMLTGCGGGQSEETTDNQTTESTDSAATTDGTIEPCEIEFWHYMTGGLEATLTELTDKFNSENEYGITVKLVNQGAVSDLQSKLTSNAAAGTLPELAQAYNNWLPEYLPEVVHLDDFVANDFDNYEDITESYRTENSEFGFISGLPFNKSTYLYFYNKTVFDELGLEAPKTWEDYYTIGEKVLAEKNLASLGLDDRAGIMESLFLQAGTDYVTNDGVQFDNENGLAAAQLIVDLYSKGYGRLAGDGEYFSTLLSNNLIAAYIGSSAGVSYITADGWELGIAPLAAGKEGAAYTAGTNLVMFAKDANAQKATWEYMKFLTTTENTTTWAKATGYLPVRTSAFESEEYQTFMAENPAAAAAYAQIDAMFASTTFDGSNDVRTAMNTAVETVAVYNTDNDTSNDLDAAGALQTMVDAAKGAID